MIRPVGVMVLVEPIEVKTVTAGGIHLPDQVVEKDQWGAQRGKILAIGPRCEYLDEKDVGKIAIYGRYAGALIDHEGHKYRLMDNQDIKALEV